MKSFTTFIAEASNEAHENPFHGTLTDHGYKHTGSMRNVNGAEHTYKRKSSSPVTVKLSGGGYSWNHKKNGGFGPTKLNNSLNAHNGTGEHITPMSDSYQD